MLTVRSLKSFYDTICALKAVSIHVNRGEIVTLIGANGSGKSTFLKAIAGLVPKSTGSILFEEREILGRSPSLIVRSGIALVPEGRQLFSPMTVLDNLLLGSYTRYSFRNRRKVLEMTEKTFSSFPVLAERRKQLAGTLSGGEQQMLAISRALMTNPDCLIMDEPSEGLAPIIIQGLWEAISKLKEQGLSILLVEQNAHLALKLVDYVHVMSKGQVVYSGKPEELKANDEIKSSYLGI